MKKIFSFLSNDGKTTIHGTAWLPDYQQPPRAVLQIIHGMAEFAERYEPFALFLNEKNIAVVGHDHLGHGYSVNPEKPVYGYFAEKDGEEILVADSWQVTKKIKDQAPNLPCFVLGHSMGSFILRNYLKSHSDDIDGAIIMGSGSFVKGMKGALTLLASLDRIKPQKTNYLIDRLAFGHYTKYFPENNSSYDWLSKNEQNVKDFIEHPLMGFTFTNNGFYTLLKLAVGACQPGWYQTIRKNLPLYIISGELDPVGELGKGPRKIAKELEAAGFTDVTLQLYAQLRHEILNELEKTIVFADIYKWLIQELAQSTD